MNERQSIVAAVIAILLAVGTSAEVSAQEAGQERAFFDGLEARMIGL